MAKHPARTEQKLITLYIDNVISSMASRTRARRLVGGTPGGYGLLFECLLVDMFACSHTPAGLLEAIGDPRPLQARCLTWLTRECFHRHCLHLACRRQAVACRRQVLATDVDDKLLTSLVPPKPRRDGPLLRGCGPRRPPRAPARTPRAPARTPRRQPRAADPLSMSSEGRRGGSREGRRGGLCA